MRSISRAAGLLALAVAAITCTDAPTAPGASRTGFTAARLAMAPSFSPTAARAFSALEAMGIGVTQARIRLRTAAGTVARDTTIQFGTDDTLRIRIGVEIQGTQQTFDALIELLDASGMVLFSRAQEVTARAASLPAAPPPTITLEYVGPGASARSIAVTPADLTVQPGVAPVLTAVGTDAAGGAVTDLLLAWTSSDATLATVTAVGRVATVHGTGRRGTVIVTATSPTGLTGSARLTMLSLATRLAMSSGDAQVDSVGAALALPFTVRATDEFGEAVPGASITWERLAGLGTLGATTTTTGSDGQASVGYVLGLLPGVDTVRATLTGATGTAASVLFTTKGIARGPSAIAIASGGGQSGLPGATLAAPLVAVVTDVRGNRLPGVSVQWQASVAELLTFATPVALTDANGEARTAATLGTTAGTATVMASVGALSASTTVGVVAGAAARFGLLQPAPSSITVGVVPPTPVKARLDDAHGNAVNTPGVLVTAALTLPPAAAPAYVVSAATDDAGVATLVLPAYVGTIGSAVLTITGDGLSPSVSEPITIVAGAPGTLKFLSSPASAIAGTTLSTVQVALLDVGGNTATSSRDPVSLAVDSLGVLLGGTPTVNAVNGIATFVDLVIGTAGTFRLRATSGQLPSVSSEQFAIAQIGSIGLVAGGNQLLPIKGSLPADSVAFVVLDVDAQPLPGVSVSLERGALSQCSIVQKSPMVTDARGVVSTAVTAGDRPGACEVTAIAGQIRATSKIAVHGTGVTHVWFGGAVQVDHAYGVAGNWLTLSDRVQLVPTASDTAFVPNWETNMGPQLLADAALGGLVLSPAAVVDLGGFTLTTTGAVSAAMASVLNGLVIAGGSGARVSGQFDRLDVGRLDLCQTENATLDTLVVKELRVICTATVATQAEVASNVDVGSVALPVGSVPLLTVKGAFTAKSPATMRLFNNASFVVDGTATIGSCTQTIDTIPSVGVIIGGAGTINGQPALDFPRVCTP